MIFVPTSYTGLKTTFGKFSKTVEPGLSIYVPFIQKVHLISNRLEQATFKFEVKTEDNVFTKLHIAIQYKIKSENTKDAFYSMDSPIAQINAYVENVIRTTASEMTLEELFKSQDAICKNVSAHLSEKLASCGYTIENTLVTEIDPHQLVKDSLNKLQAMRRLKEASKEEIEIEFNKVVRAAEAEKEKKKLHGEGISLQRTAILDGYEKSILAMSDIGLTPKDVLDLILKTQHLDVVKTVGESNNAKVIFFDHNGTNDIKNQIMQSNESKDTRE